MQSSSENYSVPAPKLLDQVRGKIRLKHYSIRTEQAYTDWIRGLFLYFGKKHLRDMGAEFLKHLAVLGCAFCNTSMCWVNDKAVNSTLLLRADTKIRNR